MNPELLVDALARRFGGDPYRPGAERPELAAVVSRVPGMSTTYSLSAGMPPTISELTRRGGRSEIFFSSCWFSSL